MVILNLAMLVSTYEEIKRKEILSLSERFEHCNSGSCFLKSVILPTYYS
jgi:hypothetical protein